MSKTSSPRDEWSGDMLDRPEMVAEFATQLRRVLSEQAQYVARIRRDAEAMWKANRPEGYGSFEAWWRHRWVKGPFGEIEDMLEKAAARTFALEARYRRNRHEIPAARQAAAEAKQQQAALDQGQAAASPPTRRRPTESPAEPASGDLSFTEMLRRGRSA